MQRVLPFLLCIAQALNNGLGKTPGLGWNSDYCIGCSGVRGALSAPLAGFQNEAYIKQLATFINTSGLQAMGYSFVNMDASWNTMSRDGAGDWVPDPALWPSGLDATVTAVHDLGLGFGLYGDRGEKDCASRPGNLGHEVQDAAFLARHKVDWYKSDSCYASADHATAFAEYGTMRDALNKTGRPIWFALCGWNTWYAPVGYSLGNSWRVGVDTGSGWAAVMSNVEGMLSGIAAYAGAGGWHDMSLLLLPGMGQPPNQIDNARHRSQFGLHCVFAANMLLTGNLSAVDPWVLATWGNAEAVAINQDPVYAPYVQLPIAPAAARGGEYVQARVAECGGEPASQAWAWDSPAQGFLLNNASKQCLNVDGCQTEIIYDGEMR